MTSDDAVREEREESAGEPWLRVIKGQPDEEELAALAVVLRARAARSSSSAARPVSGWSAYARTSRRLDRPGPGAWVMSARRP